MKLSQIVDALEAIAPTRDAEPWDNVGLLTGDPDADVARALLTIDYTPAVAAEGERLGSQLVIAYHPPLFTPLKKVLAGSLIFDAVRRGVALYSPHTALDVAPGGTNDLLADVLGLDARRPLRPPPAAATDGTPRDWQVKLVTFVPEANVDAVSRALWDAGAGRIGRYSRCSFRVAGTGTFFGEEGTNPAVGVAGRLEEEPEVRLETVVPIERVPSVMAALRGAHPYEEPAVDLLRLVALPSPSPSPSALEQRGMGRVGRLAPVSRRALLDRIKEGLGLQSLLVAGPLDGDVRCAAAAAGSCGDLVDDAVRAGADLYLTGELRHHDADRAARAGMTVVCALHSNSERPVLARVAARLLERLPALDVRTSVADSDVYSVL